VLDDLMREIGRVARRERAARVTRIAVRLGVLSHFTEEHFREHFADASRGTVAEGAVVDVTLGTDVTDPLAQSVLLERVEVAA
jgi:hydrogenase nickel incorporation protein HypA/HybF